MSQLTPMDADLKQAQLASAQQVARQATLAADKAELELQQAREAAKRGPAPKSLVDGLKAAKDLLPASAAAPGTTFTEKGPSGTSFLYGVLPEAVRELRRAIYGAEFEYQGKTHQDVTLIYVDDDLSSLAAQYHALLLRIQTAYAIYSDLSAGQAKKPEPPEDLDRMTAQEAGTPTARLIPSLLGIGGAVGGAILPGLQVIAAGLALAQGAAQVFAIKRSVSSSDVTVDQGVFQDLLKAALQSDGRNSAVQLPSLNWDTSATVSGARPLRLSQALRDLVELTERPRFRQAGWKDLLAALNAEIAAILKAVQEFGYGHARTIEELADLLTSEQPHLLLSADLLHASVSVVTKDQAFRRGSEISVHPAVVMAFRILKPDGTVVAADTCVVRRSLDDTL